MADNIRPGNRAALIVGIAAIFVFFVGFGGWAAIAPLESAVIAPGVVAQESERKTIQHLEGGIVREILVRDGDRVKAGQVLIRIASTQAKAKLDLLRRRQDIFRARQARFEAERDGRDHITFPADLLRRRDNPHVAKLLATQSDLFREQREATQGRVALLEGQIIQLLSAVKGIDGAVEARDKELGLLQEEIADLQKLFAKGVVPKARLLALRRRAAEIGGNRSRDYADRAQTLEKITETKLKIDGVRTTSAVEAAMQLDDVRATLQDLDEQLRAAEDVRERSDVTAPHDGLVVDLRVHTPGGVVAPGEALLDLVPVDGTLVVEARIDPTDADIVHPGLNAHVRITSFNQRNAHPLPGRLTYVSPDRLEDKKTGTYYYAARIDFFAGKDIATTLARVTPGMPAEVYILAGEWTLMDYLLEPFTSVLRRAVREP